MTEVTIVPVATALKVSDKKRTDSSLDGMNILPFQKPLPLITLRSQRVMNEYVVVIEGEIDNISDFSNFIELLNLATEDDVILMQLFCPGGSMETTEYLCRRMDECAALIVVEIGLTCASGASAMAMHADEWVIYNSSTMMVHSCSYGTGYAKEMDIHGMAEYTHRMNRDFVERTYSGFLTKQEMTDVLRNGHNVYFHAEELAERWPKFQAYRDEQAALLEQQQLQEEEAA